MNNVTLAINAAGPVAPAGAPATPSDASRARFDAAMQAARTDSGKPKPASAPDAATPSRSTGTKAEKKSDDDATAKKDGKAPHDDTSIASTMLSLIGVPPKPAEAAAKAAGSAEGDAMPMGVLDDADVAKDAMLASLKDAKAAGTATAMPEAPATDASFATMLATQAGDTAARDPADVPDRASPMPLLAHAHAAGATDGPAVQVQATQPATTPQFAQELGEQIAWMGAGEVKEARIRLHPEELGSMDVRINVDGGKVNVAIAAQHPAAVHAVQQTLSQLDSMLAHHGLSLGQADVGQRGSQPDANADGGTHAGQGAHAEADPDTAPAPVVSRVSRSLVDEVA